MKTNILFPQNKGMRGLNLNLNIHKGLLQIVEQKKILSLFVLCSIAVLNIYSQENIFIPPGSSIQSVRNDGRLGINISENCVGNDMLKMDELNNLYGNYWKFYFVGTVSDITQIDLKPNCKANKISLQKGCGYIAFHHKYSTDSVYVRIYVVDMLYGEYGEVIGAKLLYQTPYQSALEIKEIARKNAEIEAAKIFWNGESVADTAFRKAILLSFDENGDGKISQTEAAQKKELSIDKNVKSMEGIKNLTGLSALSIKETRISEIVLSIPSLKTFSIDNCMNTISKLDLSGCWNLDTVKIGFLNYAKEVKIHNPNLKYLDFNQESGYYTHIDKLDISGCALLKKIENLYNVTGNTLNASGCTDLEDMEVILVEYNDIDLSNCSNLKSIYSVHDSHTRLKERSLKKLNLKGCYSLNYIQLNFEGCEIQELNLDDCENLSRIQLNSPELLSLNLKNNKMLNSLYLKNSKVKSLNLSNFSFLEQVTCWDNKELSDIDISNCGLADMVNLDNNNLSTLNLSGCYSISELWCRNNQLLSLNVADCDSLKFLGCSNNPHLSELDVTKNRKLEWITCWGTSIKELDISQSETDLWSENEPGKPITLPNASDGFKTLWVNKEQKIEVYNASTEKPEYVLIKDKSINKNTLLHYYRDDSDAIITPTENDLEFKIKVRKREQVIEDVKSTASKIIYKNYKSEDRTVRIIAEGSKNINLKINLLNGKTVETADLKGKVVLICFFASWCDPCKKDFTYFKNELWNKYDIKIIGITSLRDTSENVNQDSFFNDMPFLFGSCPEFKDVNLIPYNILIDKNGKVLKSYVSYNLDELNDMKRIISEIANKK